MCVCWRDLMFTQNVGKYTPRISSAFFPNQNTLFSFPLSNKRRLKVRYKRFSIKQLIWIFIRRKKAAAKHFLSLFVLERFRSLFPFRLPDFYYRRNGSACIDIFVHFLSLGVSHTLISNRYGYGLSYKSVWFLFRIHFALCLHHCCRQFTFYLCTKKKKNIFHNISTIRICLDSWFVRSMDS